MALLKDLTVDGKGYYGIGASAVEKRDDLIINVNSQGYSPLTVDAGDLSIKDDEAGKSNALIRGICARFKELGYNYGGFNKSIVIKFKTPRKKGLHFREVLFSGTRNRNRTCNYPLGGGYYIHLTMQADIVHYIIILRKNQVYFHLSEIFFYFYKEYIFWKKTIDFFKKIV